MAISDIVGDTLRKALAVPTDTMITLDLPLLLTKLSQVPVADGSEVVGDAAASNDPGGAGE